MSQTSVSTVLLLAAFVAANWPWLSERFLLIFTFKKTAWWRWFEWLVNYGITALLAMTLEYRVTGGWHEQQWEFYVATLCLFVVFALPGFIYHYDLKKLLKA